MTLGLSTIVGLLTMLATSAIAGGTAVAAAQSAGCAATARVDAEYAGGSIVTVTITNTAATSATRWTANVTLAGGQSVTSAWNAVIATTRTTSATYVTAVNEAYNGQLAPGASTTFGMQVTGTGPTPTANCTNDTITGEPSVTLTEADNGKTITVRVGQTLGLSLPAAYRPAAVSGPALVKALTRGGYPTDQPLFEVYRTGTVGSADVSTVTDYACLHTTPRCALPQKLWQVHVDVVGIGG
ncbi:cellulose binding domain-containing protein [Microbispora sp. RL4-1S]|uniref:Cellulose binding domain-containing protein n=1 Tax=Microbispora oryzae TaxID=2806554 RepID=A0A941ANP1_9ACTN|nr:cellulose binding domain-containing protein [Microbispora oryzae]MBP2708553.1 cellulose binding domain-containing protein [Microbispora oryzae]